MKEVISADVVGGKKEKRAYRGNEKNEEKGANTKKECKKYLSRPGGQMYYLQKGIGFVSERPLPIPRSSAGLILSPI